MANIVTGTVKVVGDTWLDTLSIGLVGEDPRKVAQDLKRLKKEYKKLKKEFKQYKSTHP